MNGVLIPGGPSELFVEKNDWFFPTLISERIAFIISEAKKINDTERFFPIWGTCLGYQLSINAINM